MWNEKTTHTLHNIRTLFKPVVRLCAQLLFCKSLEWFSIECRKLISELHWFCITSLSDCCILSTNQKWNQNQFYRLCVITLNFEWFTGLSLSYLIGQSNYFGLGFTTLDWNSLYLPCQRSFTEDPGTWNLWRFDIWGAFNGTSESPNIYKNLIWQRQESLTL